MLFIFFDGEELPAGVSGALIGLGLRGSTFAAPFDAKAKAMILLDLVGTDRAAGGMLDGHHAFVQPRLPVIDLVDFTFPCWHKTRDDLVRCRRSIDTVGEAVYELLRPF